MSDFAIGMNRPRGMSAEERKLIFASSLGTVFESSDFYLYDSLAGIISGQFFSGINETAGFVFALLAFAAGFAVRPFGALFFGRIGDTVGRKYTFLITILVMGASTFLVGLLPSYASVGIVAPVALIALRLLQYRLDNSSSRPNATSMPPSPSERSRRSALRQQPRPSAHSRGKLRDTHLKYHFATAALLNPDQIQRYRELRGYAAVSAPDALGSPHGAMGAAMHH